MSKADYWGLSSKISKNQKIQFLVTKSGQILNLTIFFDKQSIKNVYYTIFQSFCEHIFSWSEVMVLTDFSAHLTWHVKKWAFLSHFCQILNFDLLVWSICVPPELFDIGKSEGIIWSPQLKRFGHRTNTRFGVQKNIFLCLHAVDGITTFKWF